MNRDALLNAVSSAEQAMEVLKTCLRVDEENERLKGLVEKLKESICEADRIFRTIDDPQGSYLKWKLNAIDLIVS